MSGGTEAIVYVVDDDSAIRESLSVMLKVNGIASRTFATPEDFLENCDLTRPCCLVLDERLPRMSGLELLDRIPNRAQIPVFMITGHGDADMLAAAASKGVTGCFKKPFKAAELLSSIRQAMVPRSQPRDADRT